MYTQNCSFWSSFMLGARTGSAMTWKLESETGNKYFRIHGSELLVANIVCLKILYKLFKSLTTQILELYSDLVSSIQSCCKQCCGPGHGIGFSGYRIPNPYFWERLKISVFRIHDILVGIQIFGSVLWQTDPDPALFVSDHQDATIFSNLFTGNSGNSSKTKSHEEVTKQ